MVVVDDLDHYRRPWILTQERADESDCTEDSEQCVCKAWVCELELIEVEVF